ncbi:hypothetical protein DFP72DRAFT_1175696 [Ephemerocybe angulata]|uniref:Uncharacterized protein n=1 Tax=Ephemerocybe angulata TaxID=980116 RepID=A0A8H6LZE5_9AGAR|nr:hypothetical protein DFP72DRAFT_1175696 [Tulosesus angulatus]
MPNKCHITDEEVEMYMKDRKYDAAGKLICPRCFKSYPEGTGGPKNILKTHVGSENCVKRGGDYQEQREPKKKAVPSTAPAPKVIRSQVIPPKLHWNTLVDQNQTDTPATPAPSVPSTVSPTQSTEHPSVQSTSIRSSLLLLASRLDAPSEETSNRFLAEFNVPPANYDNPALSADDLWEESLNGMLHAAFGWGDGLYEEQMPGLEPERVRGLVRFVAHFVDVRGLDEGLFEARMSRLAQSIEKWGNLRSVVSDAELPNTPPLPHSPLASPVAKPSAIEILSDTEDFSSPHDFQRGGTCDTTNPYPFGLHDRTDLPWDYAVKNGRMFLTSRQCEKRVVGDGRMRDGVKEGTVYAYHGIGGLHGLLRVKSKRVEYYRLRALTQARRLAAKATTISNNKRFLHAIASSKVERVDKIIRLGLRHGYSTTTTGGTEEGLKPSPYSLDLLNGIGTATINIFSPINRPKQHSNHAGALKGSHGRCRMHWNLDEASGGAAPEPEVDLKPLGKRKTEGPNWMGRMWLGSLRRRQRQAALPGQILQNTSKFLNHLKDPACNDREWFRLHEPVYRVAEKEWKDFVEALTDSLMEVDPEIPPLPPLATTRHRISTFYNKMPFIRSLSFIDSEVLDPNFRQTGASVARVLQPFVHIFNQLLTFGRGTAVEE